jgi:hypothetical protein
MVERVAKAIAHAEGDDYYESSRFFEKAALAAIAEMREPTEEMKAQAEATSGKLFGEECMDLGAALWPSVDKVYSAMIDAALHSTEQKGTT